MGVFEYPVSLIVNSLEFIPESCSYCNGNNHDRPYNNRDRTDRDVCAIHTNAFWKSLGMICAFLSACLQTAVRSCPRPNKTGTSFGPVPASLPSVFHNSWPVLPSLAVKKAKSLRTVTFWGEKPLGIRLMSFTIAMSVASANSAA